MFPGNHPRRRWRYIVSACCLLLAVLTAANLYGQATATMLRMLQEGRVPEANQARVIGMICSGGSPEELRYIYEQAIADDGFQGEARVTALEGLLEAAVTRDTRPSGDLSGTARLPAHDDRTLQRIGVRLAGVWQVEQAGAVLRELVLSEKTPSRIRQDALTALTQLGERQARETVEQMLSEDQPLAIRYLGAGALASLDLEAAAQAAAELLAGSGGRTDPASMVDAFLALQNGPEKLGAAIAARPPSEDTAKLALRHVYAMGRADKPLVEALSAAADIEQTVRQITDEEQTALLAEIMAEGDAARGELIFRRDELSCLKCHAVSGAGGNVGPDLSPLGADSPAVYVLRSILYPEEAIKEEYVTWTVYTVDGRIHQGIIVNEAGDVIELRDANGDTIRIAVEDIDEKETTGSLMPEGLTNFLTHQELLDLVRFVSELGKPGPYAVRTEPTIQRWRVLEEVPDEPVADAPDADAVRQLAQSPPEAWQPAYGMVAGELPLDELIREDRRVLYLYGEIEVTRAGAVRVRLDSDEGVSVWIDGEPLDESNPAIEVAEGTRRILFRVDTRQRESDRLRAVVEKAPGSTAEYSVVGGP